MINSLRASVTFVTPIKTTTLKVDFDPQPGITAVVGRNGTGKSWSVLEVPRFLLFGKKALRGAASDYAKQEALGVFTFKGRKYQIERNPRRERITDDEGTVLAVGAEAVTAKVVELLGYGLDVFDLCNASVQKETDKLGKLRPAQRKELVDRLVGLVEYELAEKACKAEALGFKREAEGLAKGMRRPGEAPVKPANYFKPEIIEITIKRERAQLAEYRRLSSMIYRGVPPVAPMMPRTDPKELAHVEADEFERIAQQRERSRLNSILQRARIFIPNALPEDQLVLAAARNAAKRAIEARGPMPTLSLDEIEATVAAWAVFDAHQPSDEVTCPRCSHSFHLTGEPPTHPTYEKSYLQQQRRMWSKWDDGADIPIPAGPDLTDDEIAKMRQHHEADRVHDEAAAALAALPPYKDQADLLAAMRGAVTAWAVYDEQMRAHEERAAAGRLAQIELDESDADDLLTDEDLDQLQTDLSNARIYDAALTRYEADVAVFDAACNEVERVSQMADKFKAGAEALSGARTTLKAHLAPLLSRVASSLIFDMTAGELSSVVVDEDMEITVDGQRIETLSGAGETVANLALRIGLGQVLVRDAFPVFLGDEIDSDADDQRREATKLAIRSLGSKLDQIILVSHRQIDIADHVLDLDVV